MHLANVCTVMARDRGIVQVTYHMTKHVTTRDIESTCVLLLVRDKGRVWKTLELIRIHVVLGFCQSMTDCRSWAVLEPSRPHTRCPRIAITSTRIALLGSRVLPAHGPLY